jgi:hypothetical protein
MGVNAKGAVPALIQRVADDVWGSQGNVVDTDNAGGNTSKDAARALGRLPCLKFQGRARCHTWCRRAHDLVSTRLFNTLSPLPLIT